MALVSSIWSCEIFSGEKITPYNPADCISFASSVEPPTRSLITSVDDIKQNGSRISLFGRATLSGGGVAGIFDNSELTYQQSSDTWSYSPLQYWLSSAVYDFAGFYPYKSSGFTHDAVNRTFTYAGPYVSQLSTTAQEDILVGHAARDVAADGKGIVTLPLKHALAAVRFSVRNATGNSFYLTNQYLQGIHNTGTDMVYDGSSITWTLAPVPSGKQFECNSAMSSSARNYTYENEDCVIDQVYIRNNNNRGNPSNYNLNNNTGNNNPHLGQTVKEADNVGGTTYAIVSRYYSSSYSFASTPNTSIYITNADETVTTVSNRQFNNATSNRERYNYYYNYTAYLPSNGGFIVDATTLTTKQLFNPVNFEPNVTDDNLTLDDDGYLLVLPQTIPSGAVLGFDIANQVSITDVTTKTRRFEYGTNASNRTLVAYYNYDGNGNRYPTKTVYIEGKYSAPTPKTINLASLASITQWEAGKKYDYTITVSTSNILIGVTVVPWDDREIELK